MKKIICTIVIVLLLIGMPLAIAQSSLVKTNAKTDLKGVEKDTLVDTKATLPESADDPPDWANGNFTGTWGFDIWGEFHIPVGWMFGYYKRNTNFGYFYAAFGYFNHENISWFIQGYFFGPFMFGSLGENESANTTLFVGIGRYNETNYHWRLMGETGPTFFMDGEYTKFD